MSINVNINFDYLDRVRKIATLYTKRKTSDLFDGDYHSRQHGRSLDFDDLREYHYGDDVNYIDWKSSSRAGRTLVRRYFADRKHNVLFIGDTGKKMTGDTPAGESKEHIALMAFGVSAYLFGKQGVNYALACCGPEGPRISPFLSSPGHLEELIYTYQRAMEEGEPRQTFAETLANTAASFSRHMIMVIITDGEGLAEINRELVRRLIYYNDVYIFKIEDAYMTSFGVYDLDADRYADPFLSLFGDLHREEEKIRENMEKTAERILVPNRVFYKSISREEEILDALIWLFRRRREVEVT
jgi:uncharacterized protein (DUF58 family)